MNRLIFHIAFFFIWKRKVSPLAEVTNCSNCIHSEHPDPKKYCYDFNNKYADAQNRSGNIIEICLQGTQGLPQELLLFV